MLRYAVARIGLFLLCYAALFLMGMRGSDQQLFAVLIAALVSMVLSFWLLKGMRDRVSDQINARVAARMAQRAAHPDRRGEDEIAEDAEDDPDPRRE